MGTKLRARTLKMTSRSAALGRSGMVNVEKTTRFLLSSAHDVIPIATVVDCVDGSYLLVEPLDEAPSERVSIFIRCARHKTWRKQLGELIRSSAQEHVAHFL